MSKSYYEVKEDVALYRSLRKKGLSPQAARDAMKIMGIDINPSQLPTSPQPFRLFQGKPDRKDNFPHYHHRRKF